MTACSTPVFIVVNSAPYVDVWTEFCLFDSHRIGVLSTNIVIPVMDLQATKLCPWLASQKILIVNLLIYRSENLGTNSHLK